MEQNPESKTELLAKNDGATTITEAGRQFLEPLITNSDRLVYAFTGNLDAKTIAAAMARLSRRGDDLRITLLDEFSEPLKSQDENLLKRIITAYGDDSVQQLAGEHLVVEEASNLLTKKLEWGRLAAYLEQSTRYIYYDQKDKEGRYRYVVPPEIQNDQKSHDIYCEITDQIFDTYSLLIHRLTDVFEATNPPPKNASASERMAYRVAIRAQACDATRELLPASTKATVGIFASGQALENMVMRLLGDDLQEASQGGEQILQESRKVMSVFLERADKPERGGATTAYHVSIRRALQKIAEQHKWCHPLEQEPQEAAASLVDYNYRSSELDLVANMMHEYTHLPLKDLETEIAGWSVEDKLAVFEAYVGERLNRRQKPGRAFEKIHYSWEIVSDYGIFRDLQRHRMVEDLTWQRLTPYLGYQIPPAIEEQNLTSVYEQCFVLSEKLYAYLNDKFGPDVAQYATLFGHNMRWKVSYNARQAFHIHELRTTPQCHPSYRRLVNKMHQQISTVHPHLGAAMKFVNLDEDPRLTRLAAERYHQFKLEQLGQSPTTS